MKPLTSLACVGYINKGETNSHQETTLVTFKLCLSNNFELFINKNFIMELVVIRTPIASRTLNAYWFTKIFVRQTIFTCQR